MECFEVAKRSFYTCLAASAEISLQRGPLNLGKRVGRRFTFTVSCSFKNLYQVLLLIYSKKNSLRKKPWSQKLEVGPWVGQGTWARDPQHCLRIYPLVSTHCVPSLVSSLAFIDLAPSLRPFDWSAWRIYLIFFTCPYTFHSSSPMDQKVLHRGFMW